MTVPVFSPRYMGDADAVMWAIERDPVLRSPITAVALLDRAPDWDVLRARMERATRLIPRLRQVVVPSPLRLMPPRWVLDPRFDLQHHLRRVRAPAPRDIGAVLDIAAHLSMDDFDRVRPLWSFVLVEGLKGGRAALVQKLHHTLTDGEGAVQLALHLYDLSREGSVEERHLPPAPDEEDADAVALARDALTEAGAQAVRAAVHGCRSAVAASGRAVTDPFGSARRAVELGVSVGRVLAPAYDTHSPVMRERSRAWHFRVFDVSFDGMHRAARAAGGTLNDAFMAAAAGGLRRYHAEHGARVDELRVTMPISYRRPGDPLGGNKFMPARFLVPVGNADVAARIREMGERCRKMQGEPALPLTDVIAGVLDRLPPAVLTGVMGAMLKHVDFMATNVRGIHQPLYLAGSRIERLYAFGPLTGAAVNIALYTHDDACCVGLATDDAAVPDTDVMLRCMREGFDEVLALGAGPFQEEQRLQEDQR